MKKEVLSHTETLLAASLPTIIFVTVFLGIIVWVFRKKESNYQHLEHLPLD